MSRTDDDFIPPDVLYDIEEEFGNAAGAPVGRDRHPIIPALGSLLRIARANPENAWVPLRNFSMDIRDHGLDKAKVLSDIGVSREEFQALNTAAAVALAPQIWQELLENDSASGRERLRPVERRELYENIMECAAVCGLTDAEFKSRTGVDIARIRRLHAKTFRNGTEVRVPEYAARPAPPSAA